MKFIEFTGENFPPVGERVLCRVEYWEDYTPIYWVDPENRKGYYIVLYWDGEVWHDGWNESEWGNFYVTHYALIQPLINANDYLVTI